MTFSAPLKLPPELAGIISKKASEEDLGTIVFILKVLTIYFKDEIPEQAYKELMERYSETRTQKRQKYLERRKKALMRLGNFSEEEAEDLAKLPKDELKDFIEASKAKAYNKQTEIGQNNRKEEEITDLLEELADVKHQIEALKRNVQRFGKTDRNALQELEIKKATLEKKISELETEGS